MNQIEHVGVFAIASVNKKYTLTNHKGDVTADNPIHTFNLAQDLHQMPFLGQSSNFIQAWDQHQGCPAT